MFTVLVSMLVGLFSPHFHIPLWGALVIAVVISAILGRLPIVADFSKWCVKHINSPFVIMLCISYSMIAAFPDYARYQSSLLYWSNALQLTWLPLLGYGTELLSQGVAIVKDIHASNVSLHDKIDSLHIKSDITHGALGIGLEDKNQKV